MGTVTGAGIEVVYDEHGADVNGTVVLICGTGQPAAMWSAMGVVDALTHAGYRVITFDNRGMAGAACPAPPWTVATMADDAIAVLEAVGRAHVLGASLGALITQNIAIRRPDLVRTATLMIGGGQFGPAWAPVMTGMVELHQAGGVPASIETFMLLQAMLTPEQRADASLVQFAIAMGEGLTETFGPGGKHGQHSASATWCTEDHVTELADIAVPVLVVAHEHDPIFPTAGLRAVAATVPDGTYVEIPGVSHVAFNPEVLAAVTTYLLDFLRTR